MTASAEAQPVEDFVSESAAQPAAGPAPAPSGREWPMAPMGEEEALAALAALGDTGIRPDRSRPAYRAAKRALDIALAALALAALALPLAAVCLAVWAKSPGASPIYGQLRVGRVRDDGTLPTFRMWKVRSMVPDADAMLPSLMHMNEATGPLFKVERDPRVIPGIGEWIRRHSVDELPQLANVVAGDMSLIGPRPALPREAASYGRREMGRLAVRPGCGGAWQAGPRSAATFEEMVGLDLAYVEGRSLATDARLALATARAMLDGEGAW